MKESVTPHKISILILIRVFGEMKLDYLREKQSRVEQVNAAEKQRLEAITNPVFRRNFCMLMLNLIQGPDISLINLCNTVQSKEKVLYPDLLDSFLKHVAGIIDLDIEGLLELVCRVNMLMSEPTAVMPVITKTSVIGLYIRRNVVLFEKLSCSGVVEIFKAFENYQVNAPKSEKPRLGRHLLFSSPTVGEDNTHSPGYPEPPGPAITAKDSGSLWTRRQAELFLAQQSSIIIKNEAEALEPDMLHARIQELLHAIPDCSEAHFLSYLNFLRVKDFCGALHSLYHCFDCGAGFYVDPKQGAVTGTNEDKARSFRYGALNLAMFYAHFGHKKEAMLALKECVMLAHGSSCNFCLQHALCWLYRLNDDNKSVLMERSIARSNELSLNYLASLGIQSLGQYGAFCKKKPHLVFEMLTKSDVLNCQHSMLDLTGNSFTLKSTLWSMYGRPAMAGLYAQLLLHSESQDSNSEATCLALCQLASQIMSEGNPKLAASVLWHAKTHFPQLATQKAWVWCEQVLSFEHNVRQSLWQDARRVAEQLASTDKWETMLRLAELQLLQGDQEAALARVTSLIESCCDNSEVSASFNVRATLLAARILGSSSRVTGRFLVAALKESESRFLTNLNSIITLRIAEHQLAIGFPTQALHLISSVLLNILSHGSMYEQAEVLFLQAKCQVAKDDAATKENCDTIIASAIKTLLTAKEKFEICQAVDKVREVLLLLLLLHHMTENNAEKFKLALELRLLDEQIASKTSSHV